MSISSVAGSAASRTQSASLLRQLQQALFAPLTEPDKKDQPRNLDTIRLGKQAEAQKAAQQKPADLKWLRYLQDTLDANAGRSIIASFDTPDGGHIAITDNGWVLDTAGALQSIGIDQTREALASGNNPFGNELGLSGKATAASRVEAIAGLLSAKLKETDPNAPDPEQLVEAAYAAGIAISQQLATVAEGGDPNDPAATLSSSLLAQIRDGIEKLQREAGDELHRAKEQNNAPLRDPAPRINLLV